MSQPDEGPSAAALLDRLDTVMTEPNATKRAHDIGEVLVSEIAAAKPQSKDAVRVLQALGPTLVRFQDQPSRLAVEAALGAVVQVGGNVRLVGLLVGKLAKDVAAGKTAADEAFVARGVLVRWSCIPVEKALDELVTANVFGDLVDVQAGLLDALGGKKSAKPLLARVAGLMRLPGVFDAYLRTVQQQPQQATSRNAVLVGLLVDHCVAHPELLKEHKAALLGLYVKDIVGSKTAVPAASIAAFTALHPLLSLDEYKTAIHPVAERMLLRSPEVILAVLASVLKHVTFDTSSLVSAYAEAFANNLKSNTAEQRAAALGAIEGLAKNAHDAASAKVLLTKLASLLNSVLPSNDHRLAVIAGVRALAAAPDALDLLSPIIAKEAASEITYVALMSALGQFTNLDPAKLTAFIETGLKSDKSHVRRSTALLLVQQQDHIAAEKAAAIQALLVKAVEKVSATVNPTEGIAELLALALTTDPIHPAAVAAPTAYYLQEKFYVKLGGDDAAVLTKLVHANLLNKPAATKALVAVFVFLGTLGPSQARVLARSLVASLLDKQPDLVEPVVAALQDLLGQKEKAKYDDLPDAPDFAAFLSSFLSASSLVAAFVVAHHPLIGRPVWALAAQKTGDAKQFVGDHIDALLAAQPLSSASLQTLAELNPEVTTRAATALAVATAESQRDQVVSETDLSIFKTDEGQLFVDVLAKKDNGGNGNSPSPRGGRRDAAYSFEDEQWEIQVRKELAAKRSSAPQKKLTKEEEAQVKAQLEKESAIRARVAAVRGKYVFALGIVDTLSATVGQAMEAYVPDVLHKLVMPLLASPVAHKEAGVTFQNLARCMSENIHSVAANVPVIWMLINSSSGLPVEFRNASVPELVEATLPAIVRAVDVHGELSPATLYFLMLILEPLLTKKQKLIQPEMAESLVRLINTHTHLGASLLMPRHAMIKLYLDLIRQTPSLSKLAHTGITELSVSIGETVTQDETQLLLDALLDSEVHVRLAALEALENVPASEGPLGHLFVPYVWNASHDANENVVMLAKGLWQTAPDGLPEDTYADALLSLLVHDDATVRENATRSIAAAVTEHPDSFESTIRKLYDLYKLTAALPEVQLDEYGRPIKVDWKDPIHLRVSIADAIKETTQFMTSAQALSALVAFLISDGFADRSERVRLKMLEAAQAAIKQHGDKHVGSMLPIVENYLNMPAPASEVHDRVRESVILLVGELAAFLAPTDPKVPSVLKQLLGTLTTPSEQVQMAVANCLPGLVKSLKDDVGELIQQMIKQTLDGAKYGDRRGAAYGLAGLVKGKGISALKDYNIINQLKDAIENKKVMQHRQGALMAYETLSALLGRLFEPYVIQILPLLLVAFGDGSQEVREAVADASRVIMSKLSAHCVKLILPSLLVGLGDEQWRTKQGSAELLGSMAFLAPKQLSSSLPGIVPKLTDILADSHPKVVTAGKQALQHIGSVIKNPEIQTLVPLLMKALVEPNKYTSDALNGLLQTSFVHVVDAPSLALVAPILQRGLKERSTDVKKMAAQIMSNMSSLVDEKDFVPYLPVLIPGVQTILIDPIPEVRKIAARALGTMVTKMGEQSFEGLIPWLLTMLKSESSGVDRAGAAQGLSEVLKGLGKARLDVLLPDIITNASSPSPHVREGCISVLVYLPNNFGEEFTAYLSRVIPPVLRGLADESEPVRDVSLRAGQVIVSNYSRSAVELLLPSLQKGLFDDNWRIRQSSIQLMGDLLYRITGATGKTQVDGAEEEDGIGTEEGRRAVISTLGQERRDLVLASLYVLRNDISLVVRQSSLHVWKTVVSNTPKTLREVLPVMMNLIIECLSASSHDKRQLGARCLGELVRKQGERVLPEVMPTLEEGLLSPLATTRQGVCIGLNEIMLTAGKQLVTQFIDIIVHAVRQAICDPDPMVREPAAEAFATLYKHVGRTALDEILPALLANLGSTDDDVVTAALEGLQLITAARSDVVFPMLIDQLLHPITSANARALGLLIPSAGKALNKYLSTILSSLFKMRGDVDPQAIDATATVLLTSVQDQDAGRLLVSDLLEKAASDKPRERQTACDFIATFCANTRVDYTPYVRALFRTLLYRLNDTDQNVVSAAWGGLDALTRTMKKEQQPDYLHEVRRAMQNVVDDAKGANEGHIKGFCMPKGIVPLMPMMLQGLMYGRDDVREQSALGLGDLVRFTDAKNLTPQVVQMTGPLIRVAGDRFNWQVKAAILETMGLLLTKVSAALRPFVSQLQTTFVRALSDTTQEVRLRAASGLGKLIPLQPRVDSLITELVNGAKTCDPFIRETFLRALFAVLRAAGAGVSAPVRTTIQGVLVAYLSETEEDMRTAAAHCLGALSKSTPAADVRTLVTKQLLPSETAKIGAAQALTAILQDSAEALVQPPLEAVTAWIVQQTQQDDKMALAIAGLRSIAYTLMSTGETSDVLLPALALALGDKKPTDVRLVAAVALKNIAKANLKVVEAHLALVVPPLLAAAQEKKSLRLKLATERALLYSLGLNVDETVLQAFLAKSTAADPDTAKALQDYHRRVLSKLAQRNSTSEATAAADGSGDVSDDDQEMDRSFEKKLQL